MHSIESRWVKDFIIMHSIESRWVKDFIIMHSIESRWVKDFIMMHSIESRWVKGPETILYAGTSTHLSARKLHRLGQ